MRWPEQDQHSQNQHSRPAAGLRALESESASVLVLESRLVSALALESVSRLESGLESALALGSESVLGLVSALYFE